MTEQKNQQVEQSEADRGLPSIGKGSKSNETTNKAVIMLVAGIVLVLLYFVNFSGKKNDDFIDDKKATDSSIANRLGDPPPPPVSPKTTKSDSPPPPTTVNTKPSTNGKKRSITPDERKRMSSLMAFNTKSAKNHETAVSSSVSPYQGRSEPDRPDTLGSNLKPTQLRGAKASVLQNRDFYVTQGTFLDCALETAISSDQSGMTACRLTADIYSTNGRVLLLEKGSKIVGQYQGGVKQGQARVFVLWTRVETPTGVLINLDSPGTDPLGRSGLDGYVDTHFWQRFGGAILLSMIDIGGQVIDNQTQKSNSDRTISVSGSGSMNNMATETLRNSINIPPTIIKNQGDHISIFVARDLDFRGVYELKVTN